MAGYYGKVPGKGDFVFKDLAREVSDTIHAFFADGMETAIEDIGPQWVEDYSVSPIWYFYLQPDVISRHAWIGMWMPSVDRVNRHFPITVMQALGSDTTLETLSQLGAYQDWFFDIEDLLLDTLEPNNDADSTLNKIAEYTLPEHLAQQPSICAFLDPEHESVAPKPQAQTELEQYLMDRLASCESKIDTLEKQISDILASDETVDVPKHKPIANSLKHNLVYKFEEVEKQNIKDNYQKHSFWLSCGNDGVKAQLVVKDGLPSKEDFKHFLVGFD